MSIMLTLFLTVLLTVFAAHYFYAEACGNRGKMGRGVQEDGMPMMRKMSNHRMGMMDGMHESGASHVDASHEPRT